MVSVVSRNPGSRARLEAIEKVENRKIAPTLNPEILGAVGKLQNDLVAPEGLGIVWERWKWLAIRSITPSLRVMT